MSNNIKAVFLDRDGVICEDRNLIHKKEDFVLINGSAEAIKLLNDNNYLAILISNQPVIARGLCTIPELEDIHNYMKKLLSERGAKLDSIYYCPHHPNVQKGLLGKNGPNLSYVIECECRKPKSGMIVQAQRDFKIPYLSECYMIGDSISDIRAGHESGCKTIFVGEKKDEYNDAIPDFKARNLYEAVTKIILRKDETIN